jgi:hypothetical protein
MKELLLTEEFHMRVKSFISANIHADLPDTHGTSVLSIPQESHAVTDLQGPPSERTQMEKIRDLKSLARQYARDQGSCDDTRISYLEYVESEVEADWTLARMIAG